MHLMAASAKSNDVVRHLERILARNLWTQRQLADELRITQGYLSKLKSGHVSAGLKLRNRIKDLYNGVQDPQLDPWLDSVRRAGDKSRDARAAIEAIARIIHKYS
jgi:transcriptional regulator with XRE-family HTH domain